MDKLIIHGGRRLEGEVSISGAKNAALPLLFATLLSPGPHRIGNLPRLRDIATAERLLAELGADVDSSNGALKISTGQINSMEAPYDLVRTMRASVLVLGPLLARFGEANVSLPGGCAIGARPINLHTGGLEQLGARIEQSHGYIEAEAPGGLRGTQIHFDRITVTGTEDLLMAAVLTDGETAAGMATSRAAAAAPLAASPASRPMNQVSGALAAARSQNGRAEAIAVGPSSQIDGTWMSAASGIQWALEGMGSTPSVGSLPPTSTKFQM